MAKLPPDGPWLIQQMDGQVVLFNQYTDEEIVRFDVTDDDATARAQFTIYSADQLDAEQKCFAHFWCGYFHAHAGGELTLRVMPILPLARGM